MGSSLSSWIGGGSEFASSSSEWSLVREFHSSDEWRRHFNSSKQSAKLMVVDFSASWCGPCKLVEPAIHAMSYKLTDVDFIKIDVDELSDVAQEFQVQAMPTFVLFKEGNEVERVVGAKKAELESKISKHRELPKFAA